MKGVLYYDSKYGSTEQISHWIIKPLKFTKIQKISYGLKISQDGDFYILGTPVFIGKPMQNMVDFILMNKDGMINKPVFLFITSWAQSTKYKHECDKFIDLLKFHLSPILPVLAKSLPGRLYIDKLTPKDRSVMERLLRRIDDRSKEFDSQTILFNDQTNQKQCEEFGQEIHECLKYKSDMF